MIKSKIKEVDLFCDSKMLVLKSDYKSARSIGVYTPGKIVIENKKECLSNVFNACNKMHALFDKYYGPSASKISLFDSLSEVVKNCESVLIEEFSFLRKVLLLLYSQMSENVIS